MGYSLRPMRKGGLESRMLAIAKPLDDITRKRLEYMEHARESSKAVLAPSFRRSSMQQFLAESEVKRQRILSELSALGDPAAARILSAGPTDNGKGVPRAFLDNGFLIDIDGGSETTRPRIAYGPVFARHETGHNTLYVGSLFQSADAISWQIRDHASVTNVFYLIREAIDVVEVGRSSLERDPGFTILGKGGASRGKVLSAISREDISRYLHADEVDPGFLARLSSGPRFDALCGMLNAVQYHSQYAAMRSHYAEDETDHVVGMLNGSIRDELVRYCTALNDIPQLCHLAAIAYGDTARALSVVGLTYYSYLVQAGQGAIGAIERDLNTIGLFTNILPLGSTLEYLRHLCTTPIEVMRAKAKGSLEIARDQARVINGSLLEELATIERKVFVTRENLPDILAPYKHVRENAEQEPEPREGAKGKGN